MEFLIISLKHLISRLEQGDLKIIPRTTHFNKLKMVGGVNVKIKPYKYEGKMSILLYHMKGRMFFQLRVKIQ